MVTPKIQQRRNRRHVDEKACIFLSLSVSRPRSPNQAKCSRWLSAENSLVVSSQGKRRRHMNIPPPTVIRDFRSDLDQTLDEPLN